MTLPFPSFHHKVATNSSKWFHWQNNRLPKQSIVFPTLESIRRLRSHSNTQTKTFAMMIITGWWNEWHWEKTFDGRPKSRVSAFLLLEGFRVVGQYIANPAVWWSTHTHREGNKGRIGRTKRGYLPISCLINPIVNNAENKFKRPEQADSILKKDGRPSGRSLNEWQLARAAVVEKMFSSLFCLFGPCLNRVTWFLSWLEKNAPINQRRLVQRIG